MARLRTGPKTIIATVSETAPLKRVSAAWMYILRNRSRWATDDAARESIGERAMNALGELGIHEGILESLTESSSRHVEVEIVDPATSGVESTEPQRAAATLPWEFLLATATSWLGRIEPLLVTRILARGGVPPAGARPTRFLFVQSAPGRLQSAYSFALEQARMNAATRPHEWWQSDSESLHRLSHRISELRPDAIHVSGIDNHQAARLIPGFYEEPQVESRLSDGVPDGMVVRGSRIREDPVAFNRLAQALVPENSQPLLITCNLYYSSARIAAECVRRGARAALGFQDEVNDELAELFFQAFYRHWCKLATSTSGLPRAFGDTWKDLHDQGYDLSGTGIVLWMAHSAFGVGPSAFEPTTAATTTRRAPSTLPTPKEQVDLRKRPMSEILQVEVKVPDTVNYSLLHNARPFLDKLNLNKLVEQSLEQVEVTVDLHVGETSLPFRHTEVLLDSAQRSLAEKVQLPLTAPLLRTSRERVQSSLYVKVAWQNRIAYEQTHHVTLLPVDEWLDDTQYNPWLPSFVLPRDPAVAKIVSMARRHLITLADDATAGFDGYQSIDDTEESIEAVDKQVQAIWAAVVHECKPQYINPPPAYSERTQRLRSPSEILSTGSGTCIDLALLLASCLEYIDIYPVVVLLSGHAFVGYWRNGADHDAFRQVAAPPSSAGLEIGDVSRRTNLPLVDQYGWRLATQQYDEILGYLKSGKLNFLEATGLCFNFSFSGALEEGAGNLASPEDFDSLLDVRLARSAQPNVTPLPILVTQADRRG